MTLAQLEIRPTRTVPCGTCNECCRGDAIFLHPECGDIPSLYECEDYDGAIILKHQPNGDCIYLDRDKGCTIHGRRPTVCREMDCRLLVDRLSKHEITIYGLRHIAHAARRLRKNGVGSSSK
jgi:Fe-S-cluster containining protein